jgi:hypothetical protein
MKLKNQHDHHEKSLLKRVPNKLRQYLRNMFNSSNCKNMSQGSYDIVRCMSWPHGENWRRMHPKSLNKSRK